MKEKLLCPFSGLCALKHTFKKITVHYVKNCEESPSGTLFGGIFATKINTRKSVRFGIDEIPKKHYETRKSVRFGIDEIPKKHYETRKSVRFGIGKSRLNNRRNKQGALPAVNPEQTGKLYAFSYIEMLMALFIASLLMIALAPVITKRSNTSISVSGVADTAQRNRYINVFLHDTEFDIPTDVYGIRVALAGGGGAGGNATYGSESFTTSRSWKIPPGVTKIRYFAIGGGGSGAPGGNLGTTSYAYANTPSSSPSSTLYDNFYTVGQATHTATLTNSQVQSDVPADCKNTGNSRWTYVNNTSITLAKGDYIPPSGENLTYRIAACGGGGGGGGGVTTPGGGGGSGGYTANTTLTTTLTTLYIKVGAGGGGSVAGWAAGGGGGSVPGCNQPQAGSSGGTLGGNGGGGKRTVDISSAMTGGNGSGTLYAYGGGCGLSMSSLGKGGRGGYWGGGGGGGGVYCAGGGGGGGGPTTITSTSGTDETKILFQIGGGGGGGGGGWTKVDDAATAAMASGGGGGGGGGKTGGGGGGGAYRGTAGSGSNGGLAGGLAGILQTYTPGAPGGGGVGGKSGNGYNGGKIGTTTVFESDDFCDGSNGQTENFALPGKQGALRLYRPGSAGKTNTLKCAYTTKSNGGGGGGAGQIVVGELSNLTPGNYLYFQIGTGGAMQSSAYANSNGNVGNPTKIFKAQTATGTPVVTASGGNAGVYSSNTATRPTSGAAIAPVPNSSSNWLNRTFTQSNATAGYLASDTSNPGYGGAGAGALNINGTVLAGGLGGKSSPNGAHASVSSYGAGGGGGAGAAPGRAAGSGGAGANGYVFIEYGGSNGGGGTMAEYVLYSNINVHQGRRMTVQIGKGGTDEINSGNGGTTKITATGLSLEARGGKKGNNGGLDKNSHGGVKRLDADYRNYSSTDSNEVNGKAGNSTGGGSGGTFGIIYRDNQGDSYDFIGGTDGSIAGPVKGGCGGGISSSNCSMMITPGMGALTGGNGQFGGGGGGGTFNGSEAGLGGKGGNGFVIIEYLSRN